MDNPKTSRTKPADPSPADIHGTCQVCGKSGRIIYDPEKAPPNRLCYRCAAEYGLQETYEE
jgi:hypothetical protein